MLIQLRLNWNWRSFFQNTGSPNSNSCNFKCIFHHFCWFFFGFSLFFFFALILIRYFLRTYMQPSHFYSTIRSFRLNAQEISRLQTHAPTMYTLYIYLLPVLVIIACIHVLSTFPCIMMKWEKAVFVGFAVFSSFSSTSIWVKVEVHG